MHDLRRNYILSINKPKTTSYSLSSFVTYQLSCEIRYPVLSVPLRLLVLNQRMQDSILYRGFSF